MTSLWCEQALIGGQICSEVLLGVEDGRIATVEVGAQQDAARRLPGVTVPGLANAHSHAFHRALRSRTQADRGSFWTWRDLMYRAAERLEPDSYHRLARAVFAEMAMAGISCVGEFHYVHHQADGTPYADPNEMGRGLLAAAEEAGIRITLLDTLYLHGGLDRNGHTSPMAAQRRFCDRTAERWVDRVSGLQPGDGQRIGGAIHSVRAVDATAVSTVSEWAKQMDAPVHAHVSEQVAENEVCIAHYGQTPIGVLSESGAMEQRFSAIHATHLTSDDVASLAAADSTVVLCPTTERDLGDGIGPTAELARAEVAMAVGSDSHAVIDLFEEARAIELNERLRSRSRGVHRAGDLVAAATVNGHRSLGWNDAGEIRVGNRADLVSIDLESVRLAGTDVAQLTEAVIFASTSADITDVYVDGRPVVADRNHVSIEVAAELDATIKDLFCHG